MIEDGRIARIVIADGWDKVFVNRINELFGDKVEVFSLRYSRKYLEGTRIYKTDCVLFYETIISDRNYECTKFILDLAYMCDSFVKILTEDIYCDRNILKMPREIPMPQCNHTLRPFMLGNCIACIHQETCRYESYANFFKERFDECTMNHNPFTLRCDNFKSKILYSVDD